MKANILSIHYDLDKLNIFAFLYFFPVEYSYSIQSSQTSNGIIILHLWKDTYQFIFCTAASKSFAYFLQHWEYNINNAT